MKSATAAKSDELATLRLLKAALQNEAIAYRGRGQTLTVSDEAAVARRELKRRQEAARIYETNYRPELAARERFEAEILQRYLPPRPTDEEIKHTAIELQAALGVSGPAAAGQLIKAVLAHYQGALDGGTATKLVRELLNKS